jgi:hypothetical protein
MSCGTAGSAANRVRLAYAEESVFDVSPASPTMQNLRYTSESLKQTTQTQTSNEIRDDRQIAGIIRNGINTDGSINIEMSYGSFDGLLKGVMYSAGWSSPVSVTAATTVSFVASDNSINDSGNGFGSFVANQWVRVTGSTNNNGFYKILTKANGKLTVSGKIIVDESAGASISVIMGGQLVNGLNCTSYVIEKTFQDLVDTYAVYNGQIANQLNLNVAVNSIMTGSFGFVGTRESSTTAALGGSYTSASTTDVISSTDGIAGFIENGALFPVREFSFSASNNARQQMNLGSLQAIGVGDGTISITGSLRAFFRTAALYNKYLSFSDTSLAIAMWDSSRNGYVVEFPSVKLTDGSRLSSGINTDIIADLSFTAKRHATEGVTIRIARFPA